MSMPTQDASTAPLVIHTNRLLERFLRYVQVGTAADPDAAVYPSTPGQRDLGRLLCEELREMSIDAQQDSHALVWATVPASCEGDLPGVALVAHVDTSPEAPGDGVRPHVIEDYQGGDIELPGGHTITVQMAPELDTLHGHTLITTDGTTLLGGDDKAGVAIIMELAQTLIENRHLRHGPVKLLFTCDEEIGRGTDKIDLDRLDATVAYTVDGGGAGVIDVETFSGDAAAVRFVGHNIHPAIAKDRMVNAVRGAAEFVSRLPRQTQTPETTSGREGFIHAHTIRGGVGEASVDLILRSFDSGDLRGYADQVRQIADQVAGEAPGLKAEVTIKQQYRNLAEGLRKLPESVSLAKQAFENLGRPCEEEIIRGGTDGSQLTEKGLPTPNLSSGQHNIHSVGEFASLNEMVAATEHLVELLRLWSYKLS
ncbi:MAG: peptidase T [Planctomycetota bacterium]